MARTAPAEQPKPGISAKVSNAGTSGALVVAITWALTYFIPAFHSGIPPTVEPLVVAGAGLIAAWVGGYRSTHRATVPELHAALEQARALLAAEGAGVAQAAAVTAAVTRAAVAPPSER